MGEVVYGTDKARERFLRHREAVGLSQESFFEGLKRTDAQIPAWGHYLEEMGTTSDYVAPPDDCA